MFFVRIESTVCFLFSSRILLVLLYYLYAITSFFNIGFRFFPFFFFTYFYLLRFRSVLVCSCLISSPLRHNDFIFYQFQFFLTYLSLTLLSFRTINLTCQRRVPFPEAFESKSATRIHFLPSQVSDANFKL